MPTLKYIITSLIALCVAIYLIMLGLVKFVTPVQTTVEKNIEINQPVTKP
ncbi:hypothetical protein [Bartonella sp. TP]|nr:hypothetical protein [Bartonella sp. TP]MDN5248656.1 hypothetical protein [Alphaproteobacteria bacterium]WJW79513.1 hypothetical protein QVL57_03040 [Bartonella sp. TP]